METQPLSELELVKGTIEKIFIDEGMESIVLVHTSEKKIAIELNSMEGTMLSFVRSKCFLHPHIPTIYHLFMSTMGSIGMKLQKGVIEAIDGTILYGRLHWKNAKNHDVYNKCSIGDVLVLTSMEDADFFIVKKVLDEMEDSEP